MREFKFRAWDSIGKKMYNNVGIDKNGKPVSLDIYGAGWEIGEEYPSLAEIEEALFTGSNFTVTQFTGLLDKNGEKIYEGDILTGEDGGNITITFFDGAFRMNDGANLFGAEGRFCKYWEVIGNIYENPEEKIRHEIQECN